MGQGISLKSERNNPWFKPWFNILLRTQSIVCATVYGKCLEYLGYITLGNTYIARSWGLPLVGPETKSTRINGAIACFMYYVYRGVAIGRTWKTKVLPTFSNGTWGQ